MPVPVLKILSNDHTEQTFDAGNPFPVTLVPGGAGSGDWELGESIDGTLNDSDKTITVPATEEWQLLWIYVAYAADATGGARQLQINFATDGGFPIGQIRPNATQTASQTRYYMIAPSLANQGAFYDTDHLQTPLPPTTFLLPSYTVRVYDNNAVSAAGDDMIVVLHIAQREV